MVEYKPDDIKTLAAKLLRQAMIVVAVWCLLGLVFGAVAGVLFLPSSIGGEVDLASSQRAFAGAILLGVVGYIFGSSRAFMLRVHAHMLLCYVQIEFNTRAGARPQPALS